MPNCIKCKNLYIVLRDWQTGVTVPLDWQPTWHGSYVVYSPDDAQCKHLTPEEIVQARQLGVFLFTSHNDTCRGYRE